MAAREKPQRINLALQGGGSHGAFTWGVLDRLLQSPDRVDVEAISGTSAGAMNAVVMAEGLQRGGPEAARERLHDFWRAVSDAARTSPIQRSPIDILTGNWSLDNSPGYLFFDLLNRVASPYDVNPLDINPLRDILEAHVDFEMVRACEKVKLYISATNVETGRVKVFDRHELTADMVMASACLPFMFRAVEIDGVPYWDGGYAGNPVLFPFFNHSQNRDIVIVQINPVERKGVPKSARDILNRVNEITFNSALMKEFRAIDFVQRLIEEGILCPQTYKAIRLHCIHDEPAMKPLSASSKVNAEWQFLTHLRDLGQAAATRWLEGDFDKVGKSSGFDARALFQGNANIPRPAPADNLAPMSADVPKRSARVKKKSG